MSTAIVWLRRDLRLHDHAPMAAATERGYGIIPVYVHDPDGEGDWPAGAASRWWLHLSLANLDSSLRALGSRLILRRGPSVETLLALLRETGAGAVFWQRLYTPAAVARDQDAKTRLRQAGAEVRSYPGGLLHEPWTVRTGEGHHYRTFTPFWKACRTLGEPRAPRGAVRIESPARMPGSLELESLELLPRTPWEGGLRQTWTPGEQGAEHAIERFLREGLAGYDLYRDLPAERGTSRLSPHLHFGEISPAQAHASIRAAAAHDGDGAAGAAEKFFSELGWREFAHHVLYHEPSMPDEPLDRRFAHFPWRADGRGLLHAWQRGRTGIPLVDAGMRELWHTGWLHNRVRMVAGSFLVKNLRLPWQLGERWFWDTLVDADLANNSLGWQWVAGSGADAAPYFRIFNPVRQAERFDPAGRYIARWLPELRALPAPARFAPWQAEPRALAAAGIELGRDYPRPVVDLKSSREQALDAFRAIKRR